LDGISISSSFHIPALSYFSSSKNDHKNMDNENEEMNINSHHHEVKSSFSCINSIKYQSLLHQHLIPKSIDQNNSSQENQPSLPSLISSNLIFHPARIR